jgi:hypothetical protein
MAEEKLYSRTVGQERTGCYRNVIIWMFSTRTLEDKEQKENKLSPAFGTGH